MILSLIIMRLVISHLIFLHLHNSKPIMLLVFAIYYELGPQQTNDPNFSKFGHYLLFIEK